MEIVHIGREKEKIEVKEYDQGSYNPNPNEIELTPNKRNTKNSITVLENDNKIFQRNHPVMWRCPNDDTWNTEEACVICGNLKPKEMSRKNRFKVWQILVAMLLAAVMVFFYFNSNAMEAGSAYASVSLDQAQNTQMVQWPTKHPKATQVTPAVSPEGEDAEIAGGECGENVFWTLYGSGTLIIYGEGDMADYDYDDPKDYKQPPWMEYADWIEYLYVDEGVTSVSARAFEECWPLKKAIFAESVTYIGDLAFFNAGLELVVLSASLQQIGAWAFRGCPITDIELPTGLHEIGAGAFASTLITSISIPENVTKMESMVFYGCPSLSSVALSEKVSEIDDHAFAGCESLKSVTINRVCQLGEEAFPAETRVNYI